MKSFLTAVISVLFLVPVHAQWSTSGSNVYLTTSSNLLGIGITTPTTKLHVSDNSSNSTLTLQNTSSTAQAAIRFTPSGTNFTLGASGSTNPTIPNAFYLYNNALYSFPFIIKGSNNYIGINTLSPQALLSVKGTIYCTRLKVTPTSNTTDWPDYVFANDYKLLSLDSVETYVKTNKHLSNIPSAKEIVDNGLDVADNQKAMLQKIEELTLYIIQQQKEIKMLADKVSLLENVKKTTDK